MCISIYSESLMTFLQLCKRLPRRRQDKPVSVTTIHRWRGQGLRGIRLEAVKCGGIWLTSEQAFARFVERTTTAAMPDSRREQSSRIVSVDPQVSAALDKAGIA